MDIRHRIQMDVDQKGVTLWRVLWYHNGLWWADRNGTYYSKYTNPRYLISPNKTDLRAAALRERNKVKKLTEKFTDMKNKFIVLQDDVVYLERQVEDHIYNI